MYIWINITLFPSLTAQHNLLCSSFQFQVWRSRFSITAHRMATWSLITEQRSSSVVFFFIRREPSQECLYGTSRLSKLLIHIEYSWTIISTKWVWLLCVFTGRKSSNERVHEWNVNLSVDAQTEKFWLKTWTNTKVSLIIYTWFSGQFNTVHCNNNKIMPSAFDEAIWWNENRPTNGSVQTHRQLCSHMLPKFEQCSGRSLPW